MSTWVDCTDPADTDGRARAVDLAVAAVRRAELVVVPTDTTYGVGCDAFRPDAVAALQRARGSGRHTPPPVLVGSRRTLAGLTPEVTERMRLLVDAFWPGPLTIVVPQAPSLAWDLGDARGTVAVRMPLHPLALAVLERTGPMTVTGAHRVGWPAPRDAAASRDQLGGAVSVYVEAGVLPPPPGGEGQLRSTIVDLVGPVPRLLRPGAVPLGQLRELLPDIAV